MANNTSGLPFGTNKSHSEGSCSSDTITGTQLSVGGGVRMATNEGDITLTAANIAAEKDVNIHAAGDLTVRSGQDTVSNRNTSQSKAIGTVQISDTEKFSGWHRQEHDDDSAQVSQVASTVGSLGGNVNLSAGGTYSQIASNVVAAQDINISAAQNELLTADEVGHASQRDDDLKIGVFARVKSPFIGNQLTFAASDVAMGSSLNLAGKDINLDTPCIIARDRAQSGPCTRSAPP